MVSIDDIDRILQTYSLEEILDFNDLSESEILYELIDLNIVKLPKPEPIDLYHD